MRCAVSLIFGAALIGLGAHSLWQFELHPGWFFAATSVLIVFFMDTDAPGIRVAVRPSAVGAVMDADECRDATLICLGGHVIKVDASMDAVLGWLLARASVHQNAIGSAGRSGSGA